MKNLQDQGFSLMELLVSIALVTIIGAAAVIGISDLRGSYDRLSAMAEFEEHLRLAQLKSVSEGGRGILVVATGGASYSFGYDYLPYDTTSPFTPDTTEFSKNMPNLITISVSGTIIFNSSGRVIDENGIFTSHTITLYDSRTGSPVQFATGTLTSTGVLSLS